MDCPDRGGNFAALAAEAFFGALLFVELAGVRGLLYLSRTAGEALGVFVFAALEVPTFLPSVVAGL